MMKKEYMNPEMEIVDIKMNQQLLAGSKKIGLDESEEDPEGADAPPFVF